jgi:acyl dehydratase
VPATERVTRVERLTELVGSEIRIGHWRHISQHDVDAFAKLTGDNGWIHIDQAKARASVFGGTIAQGTLILSMVASLLEEGDGVELALDYKYGVNYGYDKVRFLAPVVVGSLIRARLSVKAVIEVSPSARRIIWLRTVDIEGSNKPAMVAEAISQSYW